MGNQQTRFIKQAVYQDGGKYIIPTKIKTSQIAIDQQRVQNIFGLNDPTLLARSYWAKSQIKNNSQLTYSNHNLLNQQLYNQSNFNILPYANNTQISPRKIRQNDQIKKNIQNSRHLIKSKITTFNQDNSNFHQNGLSKVTSHSIISKLHRFEDQNQQFQRKQQTSANKQKLLNRCSSQFINQNLMKSRKNNSVSRLSVQKKQNSQQKQKNHKRSHTMSKNQMTKSQKNIQTFLNKKLKQSNVDFMNSKQNKIQNISRIFGVQRQLKKNQFQIKQNVQRELKTSNIKKKQVIQMDQKSSCNSSQNYKKIKYQQLYKQTLKPDQDSIESIQNKNFKRIQICQQTFANNSEHSIILQNNFNKENNQQRMTDQQIKSQKRSNNYSNSGSNHYKNNQNSVKSQFSKNQDKKYYQCQSSKRQKSIKISQKENVSQIFNQNYNIKKVPSQRKVLKENKQQQFRNNRYDRSQRSQKSSKNSEQIQINPVLFLKLQKIQNSSQRQNQKVVSTQNYQLNLVIDNTSCIKDKLSDKIAYKNNYQLDHSFLTDKFNKNSKTSQCQFQKSPIKSKNKSFYAQSSPQFQRNKKQQKQHSLKIQIQQQNRNNLYYNKRMSRNQNEEESQFHQNKYFEQQSQKFSGFCKKSPKSMISDQNYKKTDRSHSGRIVQTSKASSKKSSSPFKSTNFILKQKNQRLQKQYTKLLRQKSQISINSVNTQFDESKYKLQVQTLENSVNNQIVQQKLIQKIMNLEQKIQKMKQAQFIKQFESRRYSPIKQQRNNVQNQAQNFLRISNNLITKHRKQYFKLKLN